MKIFLEWIGIDILLYPPSLSARRSGGGFQFKLIAVVFFYNGVGVAGCCFLCFPENWMVLTFSIRFINFDIFTCRRLEWLCSRVNVGTSDRKMAYENLTYISARCSLWCTCLISNVSGAYSTLN